MAFGKPDCCSSPLMYTCSCCRLNEAIEPSWVILSTQDSVPEQDAPWSVGTCMGWELSHPSKISSSHLAWGGAGGIFQWSKQLAPSKNASPLHARPSMECAHPSCLSVDPLSSMLSWDLQALGMYQLCQIGTVQTVSRSREYRPNVLFPQNLPILL